MALKQKSILVWLIQSGDTSWSLDGRIQGAADLPLSDVGRQALIECLNRLGRSGGLPASTIYHPEDEAATATAALCAERSGARTKGIGELADPHLGVLEGLTNHDFAERFPTRHRQWEADPLSLAPPEGEIMMQAADRLFVSVARILKRARSNEIAIVLHSMGLGMLRCWLAMRPMNEFRQMLEHRPRIERYALPVEYISQLEHAAESAMASS